MILKITDFLIYDELVISLKTVSFLKKLGIFYKIVY